MTLRAHVMGKGNPSPSTAQRAVLHHALQGRSSPWSERPFFTTGASLFFTVRRKPNLKEKPVLRPGGEELAHKARGEE